MDSRATIFIAPAETTGRPGLLARIGLAMSRHRRTILAIQWTVVVFYLALVSVPAFLPMPPQGARILDNLTLFAQFLFWGIWWPFVMLSMMAFGRLWCGVFCPEGALTEWASHHGLGRPVPRWLKWSGWPFVAFVCTTVYGQLVSVYEYPKAALLVLGGSSVAALGIGLLYGRGKRVWCRHLCPASGVFALLSRIAPIHFRVDRMAWDRSGRDAHPVDCAPLVDIRRMTGASDCHACGRCAGHRGAVQLAWRSPSREILASTPRTATTTEALTLLFGVLGIATAAFQWTLSPWFRDLKQWFATLLIDRDILWPLGDDVPWWLLTHYPEVNDAFTWLDGAMILTYIGGLGVTIGGIAWFGCVLSARLSKAGPGGWQAQAMALVPLGGIGVFLGLSMLTLTLLRAEGVALPGIAILRMSLLGLGAVWSVWLAWRMIAARRVPAARALAALACFLFPVAAIVQMWRLVFLVW